MAGDGSVGFLRLELAHAVGKGNEDSSLDCVLLAEQRVKLAMPDDEQAAGCVTGHGRGSWSLVDERDLPNELTWASRGDDLPVAFDAEASLDDDEELLTSLALTHQDFPRGHVDLVGQLPHAFEIPTSECREQRDSSEQLELLVG
jgi:hypothetical protein